MKIEDIEVGKFYKRADDNSIWVGVGMREHFPTLDALTSYLFDKGGDFLIIINETIIGNISYPKGYAINELNNIIHDWEND